MGCQGSGCCATPPPVAIERYSLGLPMWAFKAWTGELFTAGAGPKDFLAQYVSVFNAVEGNTTFYGLPGAETVERWVAETPAGFEFCCKFPRVITHDGELRGVSEPTRAFLALLERLGDRAGPALVQLPPHFGPSKLSLLGHYLAGLPRCFRYAVEVRHGGFFDRGPAEAALKRCLEGVGAEWAIMDTRMLMATTKDDDHTREMQRRKPRLPVRRVALGAHPFVRIVNGDDEEQSDPLLRAWAEVTAEWVNEGRRPYVFVHSADDFYSPGLARRFHRHLKAMVAVGELAPFPAEGHGVSASPQLELGW